MLALITLPILGGLCPQIWIEGDAAPTMVGFTFCGLSSGSEGDWVAVDIDAYDGEGNLKANTATRGMALRIKLADPANDPMIDRIARSGSTCVAWVLIEDAYKNWPIDRVLPTSGSLSVILTARRLAGR